MTSFQEFLQKKAEEHQQPARRAKREEWIQAVNRLNKQIIEWLHESDPAGLLEIVPLKFDKQEAGLGAYEVPGLGIGLGDPSVRVFPVARNVVGSLRILGDGAELAGRVDITDGIDKYILRRIIKNGVETWEVLDDRFRDVTPLDRSRLESILQDLLG